MMMSANNITPIKRLEKDDLDASSVPVLNFFDLPESEFKKLLERRINNRLTFLSIVKSALTENVDYCTLPVRGRSSKPLPTLLKGGGEVVCQLLGLTPRIVIDHSDDESVTARCELLDETQQICSVGFGARAFSMDSGNGSVNKSIKMAVKSAYLDAVIRAGALSSLFTLDLDDQVDTKTVELISSAQSKQLEQLIANHQVNSTRFLQWLSKFSQSKNYPAITQFDQLPLCLFNSVLEKIPAFANTAN
jgi:hypothetical protein